MNDDELMIRLHRLADEDRAGDPDPTGERGFWQAMASHVAEEHQRAVTLSQRRRRLGVSLGGSTAALLAMAAAVLLYVRVQHRALPAHGGDVSDDDGEVFQDQDVGELTEGLDPQQLERVANALKKGA